MKYIYIYIDSSNNEPCDLAYTKPLDIIHAVLEDIQENNLNLVESDFNQDEYLDKIEKFHDLTVCTCSVNYTIYKIPLIDNNYSNDR